MKIRNQKIGRTRQTIHQGTTGLQGAVAAIACRVHHMILSNKNSVQQLIFDVCQDSSWCLVSGSGIVSAVRMAAKALKLHDCEIEPDIIRAHSLRAGGAMGLKITGYSDSTIRKIGRWIFDTWMMFICSQISNFYEGVAQKMGTPIDYHNIVFIEELSLTAELQLWGA